MFFFFQYLGINLQEEGINLRLQDQLQHLNTLFCYHFRFRVSQKLLNAALSFSAKGHDACVIFPLIVGEWYTPLGLTSLHFAN